eukprot:744186-Amphidinium_carterae.1
MLFRKAFKVVVAKRQCRACVTQATDRSWQRPAGMTGNSEEFWEYRSNTNALNSKKGCCGVVQGRLSVTVPAKKLR